jgi:Holliday junction resolvase RusA-like endonuclease
VTNDMEDARQLYRFLANPEPDGTELMVVVAIPGTPPSKIRARFGRGHAYSTKATVTDEQRTASFVRRVLAGDRFEGNVALGCIFYRPTRQRVDADNMLKHVCDSINGLAFADDSQITAIAARIELDRDNPRTVLVLGPHRSSLGRGINDTVPCSTCGTALPMAGRDRAGNRRRFCSPECRSAGRPALPLIPCVECGQEFQRGRSSQTMCSAECRRASFRAKRRGRAAPLSRCLNCGKELTHHRGGRCRDCFTGRTPAQPDAGQLTLGQST